MIYLRILVWKKLIIVINLAYLIIFILLVSCSYPDIDTVPKFDNMQISIQDSIDVCILGKDVNEDFSDCFIELLEIINRLWLKKKH